MKKMSLFPQIVVRISLILSLAAVTFVSASTRQRNGRQWFPQFTQPIESVGPNPRPYYFDNTALLPDPELNNYPFHLLKVMDNRGQGNSKPDSNIFSCLGRCDTKGHDKQLPCQCNQRCTDFNDCCPDYGQNCLSCDGRCDSRFDSDLPCQCSNKCKKYDDCCDDFEDECGEEQNEVVSDADLSAYSESLLAADTNNCASLVRVNLQGTTSFSSSRDNAPEPLLTVQAAAYQKPTIAKLLPLHNNYDAPVGNAEVITPQESLEESQFLDAILATTVMKNTEKFLVDKGYITTRRRLANGSMRVNNRAFRDALYQIWFGMYPRENSTLGSSGFEHVFLGEVKDGKVSGFHNWVFFSKEEANNRLNYKGRIGTTINLGSKGQIIKHKFDWNRTEKPITSMFVGTSPEFEMALYTVCFYTRPGQRCPVKLNDKNVRIQTYYMNKNGKRYVASAYPDI